MREWEALREQGKLEGEEEEEEEDIYAEARMIDVSLMIKLLRFKLHVVFAFPSLLSFSLIHLLPHSLPPFLPPSLPPLPPSLPPLSSCSQQQGSSGEEDMETEGESIMSHVNIPSQQEVLKHVHVHYQCSPTLYYCST